MPEGHTLHRLASDLTEAFGGRLVTVTSPQGRFAESAAALDQTLFVEADGARQASVLRVRRRAVSACPSRSDRQAAARSARAAVG